MLDTTGLVGAPPLDSAMLMLVCVLVFELSAWLEVSVNVSVSPAVTEKDDVIWSANRYTVVSVML